MATKKNTPSVNYAELRDRSGLTLAEVAERSGYRVATVNGLELNNKGSKRLREAVLHVLNTALYGHLGAASRVAEATAVDSPTKQRIFESTLRDLTIWRERARKGAARLRVLSKELDSILQDLDPR